MPALHGNWRSREASAPEARGLATSTVPSPLGEGKGGGLRN
jgi:hypothetical protein